MQQQSPRSAACTDTRFSSPWGPPARWALPLNTYAGVPSRWSARGGEALTLSTEVLLLPRDHQGTWGSLPPAPGPPSSHPGAMCIRAEVWSDALSTSPLWLESGKAPEWEGTGWDLVPRHTSPGGRCSARHVRCHPGTAPWLPGARLQGDGCRGVGFLPGER